MTKINYCLWCSRKKYTISKHGYMCIICQYNKDLDGFNIIKIKKNIIKKKIN